MMGTFNVFAGAVAVPLHPHDRARLLERARICVSAAAEALIQAEAFEPDATDLVDAIDLLLPRVRRLVDKYDPPEHPRAS
jgi:acyl-CoA synthetase (AMP-forming)/AMP-acid ligase II